MPITCKFPARDAFRAIPGWKLRYFGGKFTVSNIPYYSEEEELLLWSETSLRGPVISAGYERYMELFKKILPQKAEQINFL